MFGDTPEACVRGIPNGWPMCMTEIDQVTNNLLDWAATDEWAPQLMEVHMEHLEAVFDIFDIEGDELLEMLGDAAPTLTACIAEDFFTARFGERGELNIIDEYLKRRGSGEPESARRYIEALRDSTPSLYEVVGVDSGQSITVRDLLVPGEPVTVREHLASQTASVWDRIGARVVRLDGESVFTGAVLRFRYDAAKHVLRAFDELLKEAIRARRKSSKRKRRRGRPAAALRDELVHHLPLARVLTHFWLTDLLSQVMAPLPELRNTDDEALVLCEVRFPIVGDEATVSALMDGIEGFERDSESAGHWGWRAPGSPTQRRSKALGRDAVAAPEGATPTTVLGQAEIEAGVLKLSANSMERAERGHKLLSSHLGDLVGPALTSSQDPYQAMRARRAEPRQEEVRIPTEEEVKAIHLHIDDHYRHTLDEPLPILGGKTLRKAAATKNGRQEAIDWLKQLENMEHRRAATQGHPPYDTGWIWQELGIERPG